jgi:predicted permease
VIGVAGSEFSGLTMNPQVLWVPITQQPYFATGSAILTDFTANSVRMWGRLRPGFAPKAAEDELKSLAAELRKQHPAEIWEKETLPSDPGGYAKSLMIGDRSGTGSESQGELVPITALVAALGLLILAVACGNLGSLLLARGVAREREIAIRVAVGAGKSRLMRQLFTESLLLALLGSIAGLGVGWAVERSLMRLTDSPVWLDPAPDWRVALFALAAGFLSAILFGLTPAMQAARQRHRATIARQILVGAQVAASCVLLIVAGLLSRALQHALSSNPGFAYQQVISIDPGLGRHGYSAARAQAYMDALQARLRALPAVDSVALAMSPPLGRRSETAGVNLDGLRLRVSINRVDPQFFATMKIPLLRGRNLAPGEKHAVIISESLARQAWPGKDPVGRKFFMDEDSTVVGIVGSARLVRLEDSDSVEVYFPLSAADLPGASLLVRTLGAPEAVARSLAATAKSVDPNTFPELQLMKTGFRQKLRGAESAALAVSALGSVADLLACLGIVGVVSYAVSQRTREIGIRMALGAHPAHILLVVLRQFSRPVAAGLIAGVGTAAALSGLLRGQLYGIGNLDPAAYLGAIGLFAITVVAAALWPARRALRVDPMRALRHE